MRIHLELLKRVWARAKPPIRENLDVIAQEIVRLDRVVQGLSEVRASGGDPAGAGPGRRAADRDRAPHGARGGARRARIAEDVAPELPPVAGDRELLQRALHESGDERDSGDAEGRDRSPSARAPGPDGSVEIRIADEGVGIPAQDLEKIFRLYFTTKSRGSGIGLSMVYRIVQMHDGRIDVESEVDRGTVMILTLPVASGSVQM